MMSGSAALVRAALAAQEMGRSWVDASRGRMWVYSRRIF